MKNKCCVFDSHKVIKKQQNSDPRLLTMEVEVGLALFVAYKGWVSCFGCLLRQI